MSENCLQGSNQGTSTPTCPNPLPLHHCCQLLTSFNFYLINESSSIVHKFYNNLVDLSVDCSRAFYTRCIRKAYKNVCLIRVLLLNGLYHDTH